MPAGPNADEVRTGDYSAAGWAGGAPNGGGNIDNKNMVTPLEGLKLAFPQAEVTWSVGTGINGYDGKTRHTGTQTDRDTETQTRRDRDTQRQRQAHPPSPFNPSY